MLVKKGKKVYQVRFTHKKIQTGSGIQDYLLTYLAVLTANELRKLLRFFSAYSRAKNKEEKKILFKQYKDVLFSIETIEEPAIALMVPLLLSSLSSKKTGDIDDSKSTISLSTVTGGIKNKYKGIMDKLKSTFGLKPDDKPTYLTTANLTTANLATIPNTIGSDPPLSQQFTDGQPAITASGKRVGRPPNEPIIKQSTGVSPQEKSIADAKLVDALDASFLEFDAEQARKQAQGQAQAQKQEQIVKGKEILKLQKRQANAAKARDAKAKKQTQKKAEKQTQKKGQSGEGLKDFIKNSLSTVKNKIKNVTPKLSNAIKIILKYYIVYKIGENIGIIRGIIKSAPDFNSILQNRETIFKMASEINDANLINQILDKIKEKNIQIYNYLTTNLF